ncbi:MAG: aspartate/glutamate racemase family protein [Rhodobacteraceae bacterium]|uniref:aspartate/glutamate racemase family protein n=1 Tax=Salipiger sp. HF18 TaxID=2721557 RepID=UPI00142D8305|nr:HyuE hydantoin racemase [Salipiger sp. HF18]NVK60040.1 aspartate/glutamate racemase family protein [Paracoccaceae bacterium]
MILFINPNSSAHMTESIVAAAREALPGVVIEGWTNAEGPVAIQGAEDGEAAVPGLLALLPAAQAAGARAIVIGCFDDTGLAEARAVARCPVIGIGQAGYHAATLLGARFAVLTTLAVSVPVIAGNIAAQGFAGACTEVRPSGYGVLAVEEGAPQVLADLRKGLAELGAAGAEAVVLGCAGMCTHHAALQEGMPVRVVDGVRAAARLAEALAGL